MDKLDAVAKKLDELTDVVLFIKDKMVTKDELKNEIDRLENKIDNLIDNEVDKRKSLEVRVTKLEEKVF